MKKTQNKSGTKPAQHKTGSKLDLLPTFIFAGILAVAVAIIPSVLVVNTPGYVEKYNFTFTGTHCAIDGHPGYTEQIEKDKTNVEFVVSSNDENYVMPKAMEGLPEGVSYSKTNNNEAKITIGKMDKDYTVDISAITKKVRFRLKRENCLIDGEDKDVFVFYDRYTKPSKSYLITTLSGVTVPDKIDSPDWLSYTKNDDEEAIISFESEIEDHTVVTVTGTGPTTSYDFTFDGTDLDGSTPTCELNNLEKYPAGEKPQLILEPVDDGSIVREVPKHIAVTMGEKVLIESDDYIYKRNYPEEGKATLSFVEGINGDVHVKALAPEEGLFMTCKVTSTASSNVLGFAFQVTQEAKDNDHDYITVDWGDGTGLENINANQRTDEQFADFEASKEAAQPEAVSLHRHTYTNQGEHTIKFYGPINNIVFGYTNPDGSELLPWGDITESSKNINNTIDDVVTYCDFPAEWVNCDTEETDEDYDECVVLSSANLSNVTFATGVDRINDACLHNSKNLTNVSISNTVTEIGRSAFSCAGLNSVTIPSSVQTIGDEAFLTQNGETLRQLTGGVTFESNLDSQLRTIGYKAFQYAGFESFDLPESVETLGEGAFINCNQLTSFGIKDDSMLASIGKTCFGSEEWESSPSKKDLHPMIAELLIPTAVQYIGGNAFEYWGATSKGTVKQTIRVLGFKNEADADAAFKGSGWRNLVEENVIVYEGQ